MNFKKLKEYVHWQFPGVFVKHYFKLIDDLRFTVVAAGEVVPPNVGECSDSE